MCVNRNHSIWAGYKYCRKALVYPLNYVNIVIFQTYIINYNTKQNCMNKNIYQSL